MNAEFDESNGRNSQVQAMIKARHVTLLGILFLVCAAGAPGQVRQNNFQICFPLNTWSGSTAPQIDGQIDSDPGWNGAFRYVFGNGTSIPDVVVRGIRDNGNLYLGIQAYNLDTTLTASPLDYYQTTLVVLAFDPGNGTDSQVGDPAKMQRIHISPIVANATNGYRGPVFGTYYWSGGRSTWSSAGSTNTPWLQGANVQVGYDQDMATGRFRWSLEMKLPISGNLATGNPLDGIVLPDSGFFGFYIDVFPVVKVGINATLIPEYWPTVAPEPGCTVGSCTPDAQTPDASLWGNATRDPSCGGASVTLAAPLFDNIFTNNSPNSKIALNAPNTFGAYIQNTSVDASSGIAIPAPAQVTGTFTIANWGLPALPSWGPVPTTPPGPGVQPNPTNPTTIDATACAAPTNNNNPLCILKIGPWTLSGTEQTEYANANQAHQCIRVQLAPAPGSNTVVLNGVAQRNMDFGNASRFERIAEISAKGYARRPNNADGTQNKDQLFDLRVTIREEVLNSEQVPSPSEQTTDKREKGGRGGEGRVVSQLTWIANGCRHTGYYMTILKQRLEICEPVGGFGYVIRHKGAGPVKTWHIELRGDHLEKVADNLYQIHVPLDGVATVTTDAEPTEKTPPSPAKLAVFVDAGAGIPHGTFSSAFNTGFSLNAGLEYIVTSHFSAEGIFGYHHFPAKVGSALDLYQFSANGKAYLTSGGSLRPFVNAGIGGYKFSPGATYFGGNFGAGILYELGPHWGLQASYNFHAVNTPAVATKFSTIQGGIRFVF